MERDALDSRLDRRIAVLPAQSLLATGPVEELRNARAFEMKRSRQLVDPAPLGPERRDRVARRRLAGNRAQMADKSFAAA
jgi:hypothetical protein